MLSISDGMPAQCNGAIAPARSVRVRTTNRRFDAELKTVSAASINVAELTGAAIDKHRFG
jgi:hypothetical protein